LVELFSKPGPLIRLVGLIHHLIELIVFLCILFSIPLSNIDLFHYRILSMFNHKMFFECIPLLLIVDLVQVLFKYGKRVRLSEFLALSVSGLPNEFGLEDLRVVTDARVHVLSQHCVQLPQT
jgi:hypothetical protein